MCVSCTVSRSVPGVCPDKILPWCCGCFVTPQIKTDETLWMRLLTVAVVVQGTGRQEG